MFVALSARFAVSLALVGATSALLGCNAAAPESGVSIFETAPPGGSSSAAPFGPERGLPGGAGAVAVGGGSSTRAALFNRGAGALESGGGHAGGSPSVPWIDACATNRGGCDANATCTPTGSGTNSCTCNADYSGDGVSCVVDSCAVANGGCAVTAVCTPTGPGTASVSCTCNAGYTGDGADCTPIDSCASQNGDCDAHASCLSTGPGTRTCSCDAGYTGDGTSCVPDSLTTGSGGSLVGEL
jgi:hypothetical protein